jgi:hypothetical protein
LNTCWILAGFQKEGILSRNATQELGEECVESSLQLGLRNPKVASVTFGTAQDVSLRLEERHQCSLDLEKHSVPVDTRWVGGGEKLRKLSFLLCKASPFSSQGSRDSQLVLQEGIGGLSAEGADNSSSICAVFLLRAALLLRLHHLVHDLLEVLDDLSVIL